MILVLGPIAFGGLAYYAIDNALNYTHVDATVVSVTDLCHRSGTPDGVFVPCSSIPQEQWSGGELRLALRYTSPADNREHQDVVIIPTGQRVKVPSLHPGDKWGILAHDDKPGVLRLE